MTGPWVPFREPLRVTLLRTGLIALLGGAILAHWRGDWAGWPRATLLVFWVSFGGHWVEVGFLNSVRPRISAARGVQVAARLAVWFVGGVVLALGMAWTAMMLGAGRVPWGLWWLAGLGFIGVELVAHLGMQVRGLRSFYNGRG